MCYQYLRPSPLGFRGSPTNPAAKRLVDTESEESTKLRIERKTLMNQIEQQSLEINKSKNIVKRHQLELKEVIETVKAKIARGKKLKISNKKLSDKSKSVA